MLTAARTLPIAGIAVASLAATASAAVDYASPGVAYTQNFDTLANAGSGVWSNNSTLPGFYAFHSGATSSGSGIVRDNVDNVSGNWTPASAYSTSATSAASSTLYSWGSSAAADRAFGALPGSSSGGQPGDFFYALALRNTTGQTLDSVTVTYTGEQWREARNVSATGLPQPPETLEFSYQVFDSFTANDVWTNAGNGNYTRDTGLDFTTPSADNATASYLLLDGNDPVNRTTLSKTLTDLDWADGEVLVIRWWHDDAAGFDHGLGIDDLSVVAAVPEPASLALVALGMPALIRRRR